MRAITTTARRAQKPQGREHEAPEISDRIAALKSKLAQIEAAIKFIQESPKVESEGSIVEILDGLENVAEEAIAIRSRQPLPARTTIRQSSAGAILSGLDSEETAPARTTTRSRQLGLESLPTPNYLSKLAQNLITEAKVFISPTVLGLYIHLQRLLARPKAIPEALYLYANKPIPVEGSSPPKFSNPSPKAIKQAVPHQVAEQALTAAIEAKDITLALTVVDHTYCTPAWRRRRVLTKLGVPAAVAAIAPLAVYQLAQELSVYSNLMDPYTYKLYAFMGVSTYLLCTATLGFIAVTTHNDHHDRVVWAPGMPLLDRYIREDERAALDRIALAWGFKELWRRGDEEGDDWEGLRQWCMLKGMVLDKADLMPGMNSTFHTRELEEMRKK